MRIQDTCDVHIQMVNIHVHIHMYIQSECLPSCLVVVRPLRLPSRPDVHRSCVARAGLPVAWREGAHWDLQAVVAQHGRRCDGTLHSGGRA